MAEHRHESEHRYSLKTLQALFDGTIHGRISARGTLRLHGTDTTTSRTFHADVIAISRTTLFVKDDNGAYRSDIKPAWVQYAEVV